MACASCRQPKVYRAPNQQTTSPMPRAPQPMQSPMQSSQRSGDQRSRITGLHYVPKG